MRNIILIWCITFLISCDKYDFIDLVNRCDSEIVVDYSLDTIPVFPSQNHTDFYFSTSMKKGEADRLTKFGSDGWKRFINESNKNRLSIFIYQTDSLRKYGHIDSLKVRDLYKRLEFSVVDLERMEYKINICN